MKEELKIPIPKYPWPHIPSPLTLAFDEIEKQWIQKDYVYMGSESVKRYINQNIIKVAPYMSATTTSVDVLMPICRFLLYETYFDDYVEIMPLEEVAALRDRAFEVMTGDSVRPDEIGMFRQMELARKEWIANGMPQFWIERMAKGFWEFITYGIMEETHFKLTQTYPTLARYLLIRSHSIGQLAYGNMIDPALGSALPEHIHKHPAIQRVMFLHSIIIGIQNDFASIRKEMATENENFNIILLLHHTHHLSLEDALIKAMAIHDDFVAELEDISQCLPDFGSYQKEAENYVYHAKLMITGLNEWYYSSGTKRYAPEGFATPKYGVQGEKPLDFEVKHIRQE
ncbi:hypothetical protein J2786_003644 [Chryseobacterium vietnamense]|uniref:Uncharacterized protein n=1 Tax=Chryseobacterium vietnamense TaxID=866785 RepID=A0ACC6JCM9_9FLAO|nr:hypothetical protein [Chryseobacterium vietnamense]MDR6460510.1 hypothetical protein [Chryseobacterium vietnamense]